MGRLRPGAEFEYRKVEDMTIAFDKETGERIIVGYDYSRDYKITVLFCRKMLFC